MIQHRRRHAGFVCDRRDTIARSRRRQIGFEQRLEYAAIGGVTNLASRLCDEAKAGQIIASQRTYGMVQEFFDAAPIEDLTLKGFNRPIAAVEILRWRETDQPEQPAPATASAGRKG